ncbi:hypothetical protein L228DRAFT_237551 [Xylona heveae TC161]|uniref:Uncharacterized protein n=1 Tax=Xylona heveae (strain CBS 132557 / TC161) TaxID=1328760 RepID=A0A165IAU7_XYLHT|nr:hypothetical protein L228DRAFT_237551 [Xylona heveae TC161]KZF24642.1 hypothetical protein L228DRAFT_237551 [Xylona heveae TC161]
MPIKFPKGFTRRKSSGNPLEGTDNHSEPFRVLQRNRGGSKSFDETVKISELAGGGPYGSRGGPGQLSKPGSSNRGSGTTSNSTSTGGYHDTSSASARFSSSSTLPSLTDAKNSDEFASSKEPQNQHQVPIPPIPDSRPTFSLRAAGRTFSFGAKSPKSVKSQPAHPSHPPPPPPTSSHSVPSPSYQSEPKRREAPRAAIASQKMASHVHSAAAPRLDTDIGLGGSNFGGAEFGNMFENFGKQDPRGPASQPRDFGRPVRQSPVSKKAEYSPPPELLSLSSPKMPPKPHEGPQTRSSTLPPNYDYSPEKRNSRYSWDSNASQEGLMSSTTPPPLRTYQTDERAMSTPRHQDVRPLIPPSTTSLPTIVQSPADSSPDYTDAGSRNNAMRRSSAFMARSRSVPLEDEDAKLVMKSVAENRAPNRRPDGVRTIVGLPSEHNAQEREMNSLQAPSFQSFSAKNASVPSIVQSSNRHSSAMTDDEFDVIDTSGAWQAASTETTPKARNMELVQQNAAAAPGNPTKPASTQTSSNARPEAASVKKVMTPAQFEQYRRERELSRTKSNASDSGKSSASDEGYEDVDESERNRLLAKQRRKQEAHLAVYRQQMMKITGEDAMDEVSLNSPRPALARATGSMPTLPVSASSASLAMDRLGPNGRNSDDDEDEDVPLGILAAHGFPSKNRPPSRLHGSSSMTNLRASAQPGAYPPPPGSAMGDPAANGARGGNLPVFARNLPVDPYLGASLVAPTNRQSLAFSQNGPPSIHAGGAPPNVPAGGLVGVIAEEERSRALRRASPSAHALYGSAPNAPAMANGFPQMYPQGSPMAGLPPPGFPGMNMGMPMMPGTPGTPPLLSPSDQAQMQMSQQMTQMMQVQMQWMQQMMQMQNINSPSPPVPNGAAGVGAGGFLAPPGGPMQRPISMGNPGRPNTPGSFLNEQHRNTMFDPVMSQWNNTPNGPNPGYAASAKGSLHGGRQGYTPSIAPSERSNVGLPSRYRPVSVAPPAANSQDKSRASSFTSGMLNGFSNSNNTQGQNGPSSKSTVQASIRVIPPPNETAQNRSAIADEDEDEGWAQMKKRREEQRSARKSKKPPSALDGIFYPGESPVDISPTTPH